MDLLRWAKFYATAAHRDQKYGGNLPYTHHLAAVEEVLRRFHNEHWRGLATMNDLVLYDDLLQAAWLHDSIEDAGVKVKEIEELFGTNVAKLVHAVTDEPGESRAARHAATFPKTRSVKGAVALKLADRIANVEYGAGTGSTMNKKYRKEHEDFRRALYTPGEYEDMWAHLNRLLA